MADVIDLDERRRGGRDLTYFPGYNRPEVSLTRLQNTRDVMVGLLGVDPGNEGMALTPDQADELAEQLRAAAREARDLGASGG